MITLELVTALILYKNNIQLDNILNKIKENQR